MYKTLYRYTGSIAEISFTPGRNGATIADLVLDDLYDDNKPPVRLSAYGQIAAYIRELESTDDEERYIKSRYYYDRNLILRRIEIPAHGSNVPAKIISVRDDLTFAVFGPAAHITTSTPAPMADDQLRAWHAFNAADTYRPTPHQTAE